MRKSLLYAGTEKGVYVSFDDGEHWQPLQNGLPVTSVRDLQVHDNDLVIATHGRGFYILDDLAALRQANAQVAGAAAWLYAPSDAVRVRRPEFTGTPMPKDEPMAPNPPDGAYLDYVLKTAPKAPVTLDILDASGAVVRHYASDVAPMKIDLAKWEIAPEWTKLPSTLATTPGMHRFVWPLRYAAPDALADQNPYADGVWAPPGRYTVALTVDGQRLTQPLTLRPDPRIKLPDDAYAQQAALALRIEPLRARVATATHQVDKIVEGLAQCRMTAGADLHQPIDALAERVYAASGSRPSGNPHNAWALPPQRVQTLRFAAEALDALNHAVDGADAAPSPDALQSWVKLQPLAEATLATWNALLARDLPELNRKLAAAGREPVKAE